MEKLIAAVRIIFLLIITTYTCHGFSDDFGHTDKYPVYPENMARTQRAVLKLQTTCLGIPLFMGIREPSHSGGTAFLINNNGYILTNLHVIAAVPELEPYVEPYLVGDFWEPTMMNKVHNQKPPVTLTNKSIRIDGLSKELEFEVVLLGKSDEILKEDFAILKIKNFKNESTSMLPIPVAMPSMPLDKFNLSDHRNHQQFYWLPDYETTEDQRESATKDSRILDEIYVSGPGIPIPLLTNKAELKVGLESVILLHIAAMPGMSGSPLIGQAGTLEGLFQGAAKFPVFEKIYFKKAIDIYYILQQVQTILELKQSELDTIFTLTSYTIPQQYSWNEQYKIAEKGLETGHFALVKGLHYLLGLTPSRPDNRNFKQLGMLEALHNKLETVTENASLENLLNTHLGRLNVGAELKK